MILKAFLKYHFCNAIYHRSFCSNIEIKHTPDEIDKIINAEAVSYKVKSSRISYFHSNQLGVNRPIEDRWNAAAVNIANYYHNASTLGHLFSVIDGHGGHACAHAINYCHLDYIAATLINDQKILNEYMISLNDNQFFSFTKPFVPRNTLEQISASLRESHNRNIRKFLSEIMSTNDENEDVCKKNALTLSLSRLDEDLIQAALPTKDNINRPLLRSVSSGAVGTFMFVPEDENDESFYVAQVGDCGAVLGSRHSSQNDWQSQLLLEPHNYQNTAELDRVISSHPINETSSIILDNRLLGELIPLRAFGDVRFKWPVHALKQTASLLKLGPSFPVTPRAYKTPPYLISQPDVLEVPLPSNSSFSSPGSFIILGSDGLWDMVRPDEAVQFVGEWIDSNPDSLSGCNQNIGSLLIKRALGGKSMSLERISYLLSLPGHMRRYYQDDITVIVVFFK